MDEEKDQAARTFEVPFKDGVDKHGEPKYKRIVFNQPTEGQIAVMARGARRAKRGSGQDALAAVGLILDVIDALVASPDDRNWLEDGLLDTSLDLDDFLAVLGGINAVEDDEDVKPVKKQKVDTDRARSGRR